LRIPLFADRRLSRSHCSIDGSHLLVLVVGAVGIPIGGIRPWHLGTTGSPIMDRLLYAADANFP
jgi:hypothetical protein